MMLKLYTLVVTAAAAVYPSAEVECMRTYPPGRRVFHTVPSPTLCKNGCALLYFPEVDITALYLLCDAPFELCACLNRLHRLPAIKYGGPLWCLAFLIPWWPWSSVAGSWLVGVHFCFSICMFDSFLTYVRRALHSLLLCKRLPTAVWVRP